MRIVKLAQDQLLVKFIHICDQLITLSPLKETGEDITTYCDKECPTCNQLTHSGQWEWILLVPIVNALEEVSVPAPRIFHCSHHTSGQTSQGSLSFGL